MSIFDRLQRQLDIQKREQGISALELMDLPPQMRRIMKLMLREVVMKHIHLSQAVADLPEKDRMTQSELDSALKTLVEQNWLIANGEGEFLSYRVNLRRKAGSALDQDIWVALNNRIAQSKKTSSDENEDPSKA
jgi:hypothetical protein